MLLNLLLYFDRKKNEAPSQWVVTKIFSFTPLKMDFNGINMVHRTV